MLTHPTLDRLHQMGLFGMAKAFADIAASDGADGLTHGEWLAYHESVWGMSHSAHRGGMAIRR